ncbi:MAG TPA: polymer-forming cytoskeletal protein [Alphaproteobacteria bacterium]|nr:polymer-forming cytoskeletal protein [Alphaproteobacteria bacterium]
MFGPRKEGEEAQAQDNSVSTTVSSPAAPRAASPSVGRRIVDLPGTRRSSVAADGEKKLTVGKGLSLAGEITSCDILVVEGKVEAKLSDGKLLEITESGQFRGAVEIEAADIAGRFDGQLVVRGRLTVRSTGRISGMVKYGELEVNAGGQIIGEVQVTGGGAAHNQAPNSFKSAAKFVAPTDEDLLSDQSQDEERKSA